MPIASCSICFEDLIQVGPDQSSTAQTATASTSLSSPLDEESKDISSVSTTPCGHVFHTNCVSAWLEKKHRQCPQCRRPVAISALTKLFLAQQQQDSRLQRRRSGSYLSSRRGSTSSASSFDEAFHRREREGSHEREEHRIIKDVLLCQLEDYDRNLKRLAKDMAIMEEQLSDKVKEVSSLEAELVDQRRKREQSDSDLSEARDSLKSAFAGVERDNVDLREQLYSLRDECRRKDLEIRDRDINLSTSGGRIRRLEEEIEAKETAIRQLKNQLDTVHNLDYSIYESLDGGDEQDQQIRGEAVRLPKSDKWTCRGCLSCIKTSLLIGFVLVVFLALCIVLPLKIVFSKDS